MSTYYPSINSLLPSEQIPSGLESFVEDVSKLLRGIYYQNLIVENSSFSQESYYHLFLIFKEQLELNIVSDKISLLLFPNPQDSESVGLPVILSYQYPLLKYVEEFDLETFDLSVGAVYELLLEVLGIDEKAILISLVDNVFGYYGEDGEQDPIEKLIESINENADLATAIEYNNLVGQNTILKDVVDQLNDNGNEVDVFQFVLETYLTNDDVLGTAKEKIEDIFSPYFSSFSFDNVLAFLLPHFSLTINSVTLALAFSRDWLKPIDEQTGALIEDESVKSQLSFDAGSIGFSTEEGFVINGDGAIHLTRSQIGDTGLEIVVTEAKIDLRSDRNIPEANADGRDNNFKGIYIEEAEIKLPSKWFSNDPNGTTLGIFGQQLLIGTGGLSGRIGLKVKESQEYPQDEPEASFILGKAGGFQVGFQKFDMEWSKGNLESSSLEGHLTIPRFKEWNDNDDRVIEGDLRVEIEMFLSGDSDFSISAKPNDPLRFCMEDVFIFEVHDLEIGRDDDRFYLCFSGGISFADNDLLKEYISEPIIVQDFCIYSDGSFEIGGGSIPLPDTISVPLGPVNLSVNAIHLGAYERQHEGRLRQYRYFGFDAGLNINPGGVEANGKGLKYYFTVDGAPFDHFFQIESLQIDLQFPGDVKPEEAALIVSGFLSVDGTEYTGAVDFKLPQIMIAGGAGMKYDKSYPAFLIDAFVELPVSIPLANSGLGIYGFRGLFGLRYIAARDTLKIKEALNGQAADTWTEYYVTKAPKQGVHIHKFHKPENAQNILSALSIGAGTSIATAFDDGKSFSSQLFLLISLLDTILLEGKGNYMGKRVGLTGGNPPFGVVLSFNRGESILLDTVIDYKLPQKDSLPAGDGAAGETVEGTILTIGGDINAGFFFDDPGAWYINIGTREKKLSSVSYRIFLTAAYLMISKQGLEIGATRGYEVNERFGPVKVTGDLNFEMWGKVSFTKETIGGGIQALGGIEARFMGVGFGFYIRPYLAAIAPKPFLIRGGIDLCVKVDLFLDSIEKCFKVGFEFPDRPDRTYPNSVPIYGLPEEPIAIPDTEEEDAEAGNPVAGSDPIVDLPVRAVHMVSGQEYAVNYNGSTVLNEDRIDAVIPMDCWIDIEFKKPVNPMGASGKVRCMTQAAGGHTEDIPPIGNRVESHDYSLEEIQIEYYDGENWLPYHPYQAIPLDNLVGEVEEEEQDLSVEVGKWQIGDRLEHKKIRLLADSPFSYTNHGQAAWYDPGKAGITGAALFCEGTERKHVCISWEEDGVYEEGRRYTAENLTYRILHGDGTVGQLESCAHAQNQTGLTFDNGGRILLYFHEPMHRVSFSLGTTHNQGFVVKYYSQIFNDLGTKRYNLLATDRLERSANRCTISHEKTFREGPACSRIEIISFSCSTKETTELKQSLKTIENIILETKDKEELINLISRQWQLKEKLYQQQLICCEPIDGKMVEFEELKSWEYDLIKAEHDVQEINDKLNGCDRKNPDDNCKELLRELRSLLQKATQERKAYDECLQKRKNLECKSVLYSICFLSESDYQFNQNLPDQETLQEGYNFLSPEAKGKVNQVIWRPDTTYRCKLTLSDRLSPYYGDQSTTSKDFYFGFKTGGPLGHFDRQRISKKYYEARPNDGPSLQAIQEEMNVDGVAIIGGKRYQLNPTPENHLKYYIDFEKSYPNADGDLLYAKPLYYARPYTNQQSFNAGGEPEVRVAPSILLFFKDIVNYADLFFKDWSDLQNPVNNLIIDILDPVDGNEDVATSTTWETIAVSEYFADQERRTLRLNMTNASRLLDSYVENATCVREGVSVDPYLQYLRVKITNLKPNKLYNVVVKNSYNGIRRIVHSFNFKTSAYDSFEEHMSSYVLSEADGNSVEHAVFELPVDRIRNKDVRKCWKILKGNPLNDELDQIYPDNFDKLIYGVLKQNTLPPPECNEFNIVRRREDQEVIGIWIRSKEPFNDPKIEKKVLYKFKVLEVISGDEKRRIKYVMSKDYTQIYLMHPWFRTFNRAPSPKLKFNFRYLEPTKGKGKYEVVAEYQTGEISITNPANA